LRLDAHHSFSERYPLATLSTILTRNRFDGSILVAALQPEELRSLPAFIRGVVVPADRMDLELLDLYRRSSRFLGLAWRPGASGVLRSQAGAAQSVLESPAGGAAQPQAATAIYAAPDAAFPEYLAELQRRELTLDVWDALESVPRIAARFRSLRIAIVHLGSPLVGGDNWGAWAAAMKAAAGFPQVCCKLSGLLGLATSAWRAQDLRPYVQHALTVFGPDRLMFGSGWPDCLPEHTWKETLAAFTQSIGARPIEVREQLLGATAARFYGIAR
jgi:hypothetical protein